MQATDEHLHILQFSDCHLLGDPTATLKGWDTYHMLEKLLHSALSRHADIDMLLFTGDISQDESAASYRRLVDLLHSTNVPVFALPGNHDNVETMRSVFAGYISYDPYIHLKNWQILLIDSTVAGYIGGHIAESELKLLDEMLDKSVSVPTVLALHHPPVPIGSPWMDAMGLANADELFDCVKNHPHVKVILFGHAHQVFDCEYQGIRILGAPSTCFQFMPGCKEFTLDPQPQGYRQLEFGKNDLISTTINRLGASP